MREILFRGKADKKWIYGNLLQTDNGAYIIQNYAPFEGIGRYEVDPETVCQYTGLPDKNGKKIFEGDIVKIRFDDEECIGKIFYNKEFPRFSLLFGTYPYDISADETQKLYEIIGNIFDNLELIGE